MPDILVFVYFKGREVEILRYPVTVNGKIPSYTATGSASITMDATGKADGKNGKAAACKSWPISQETLVYSLP